MPHPTTGTTTIVEGTLLGCSLSLVLTGFGQAGAALLHLDRHPASYTRTLTGDELAALARLNPDDAPNDRALPVLADLTIAATALGGAWPGLSLRQGDRLLMGAVLTPIETPGLTELGRCASALVAAIEGAGR